MEGTGVVVTISCATCCAATIEAAATGFLTDPNPGKVGAGFGVAGEDADAEAAQALEPAPVWVVVATLRTVEAPCSLGVPPNVEAPAC